MFFDPLLDAHILEVLDDTIAGRDVAVLLTYNGHERSSGLLVERFGATVCAPAVSRAPLGVRSKPFAVGDALPAGVEATTAYYPNEATFWVAAAQALVAGDVLLADAERGVRIPPDSWLAPGLSRAELQRGLSPLLELPVETILLAHGAPVTNGARRRLAEALAV